MLICIFYSPYPISIYYFPCYFLITRSIIIYTYLDRFISWTTNQSIIFKLQASNPISVALKSMHCKVSFPPIILRLASRYEPFLFQILTCISVIVIIYILRYSLFQSLLCWRKTLFAWHRSLKGSSHKLHINCFSKHTCFKKKKKRKHEMTISQ